MKNLIPHVQIFIAACIILSTLCFNASFAFPISDSSNLVQNSSFEINNQPTLQYWVADTMLRKFVQDVPPNGGQWSLQLVPGWAPQIGYAQTYISGQSGVGVYELTVWMKCDSGWRGSVTFGQLTKNGWSNSKQIYCDSTAWTQISLLDTFSLQPNDTLAILLSAGWTEVKAPKVLFDLVHLERIKLITAVTREYHTLPARFALDQNYPNPFNPTTVVNYRLATNGFVSLKVFDVQGGEITTLVYKQQTAGDYSVIFDAGKLKSGIYFCSLQFDQSRSVRKMLFLK